ncbi:uncharacterized protein LOC135209874 [Macrobrachium nipponense]|uniref:uncharacterized protein LOC135209874 n=1 Tax=Macrobrachium nipponense TaxID=159736 RepID=UPI0030C8A82A
MKGSIFVVVILTSLLMAGRADHKEEEGKKEEKAPPANPFLPIQAALPPPVVSRRRSSGYGKRSIPDGALEEADAIETSQSGNVGLNGDHHPSLQFQAFASTGAGTLPTRRRPGGYGK